MVEVDANVECSLSIDHSKYDDKLECNPHWHLCIYIDADRIPWCHTLYYEYDHWQQKIKPNLDKWQNIRAESESERENEQEHAPQIWLSQSERFWWLIINTMVFNGVLLHVTTCKRTYYSIYPLIHFQTSSLVVVVVFFWGFGFIFQHSSLSV